MNNFTILTSVIPSTINTPKYFNQFRRIQLTLVKITNPYIFIISCLGLITNTSTIAFLSKSFLTKNLRHKWTLIALALSDLILNIALLIRVGRDVNKWKAQRVCEIISFLSQLAEILSACFTVMFTIQRYIAVRYPLQVAVQKQSSPIIPLVLVFLFSIAFCWAMTHSSSVYVTCEEELQLGWFIADALCAFIIPFSLIIFFNVLIVNLIRKHSQSSISAMSTLPRNVTHSKRRKQRRSRKNTPNEESYSMTYSFTVARSSNGPLPDDDVGHSLAKFDRSLASTKQKESVVLYSVTDEVECPASESPITVPLFATLSTDTTVYNHVPVSPRQSRSSITAQKAVRQVSLKSNGSREIASSTNESDCSNAKEAQTNQSIRVTRMLILVSSCFLILNAPAHICVIALKIYVSTDAPVHSDHAVLENFRTSANLTQSQLGKFVFIETNNGSTANGNHSFFDRGVIEDDQIFVYLLSILLLFTQLISYASYSINFFLYSFSGVAFRTGLRQFLDKLWRR